MRLIKIGVDRLINPEHVTEVYLQAYKWRDGYYPVVKMVNGDRHALLSLSSLTEAEFFLQEGL